VVVVSNDGVVGAEIGGVDDVVVVVVVGLVIGIVVGAAVIVVDEVVGIVVEVDVDGSEDTIGVAVASGVGAVGLAQSVAVGVPKPAKLWARTRNPYEVPFVNPLTRNPVPPVVAPAATQALPFHRSTTYLSIGAPPVDAGGVHENQTVPLPGIAEAERGADGTVARGVALTVVLWGLHPMLLRAAILNR
jgi:hypothetical protein